MALNKQKGNMYPWVDYTINFVKGKCPHGCSYCFMEKNPSWKREFFLDESEFDTDLGSCNTIFIGSSCDHFAGSIPYQWIDLILTHLALFPENKYLLQTKNPKRLYDWIHNTYLETKWNRMVIIGTTLETNRDLLPEVMGAQPRVPSPMNRQFWLRKTNAYHKMVSIEPIMDFDLDVFVKWIQNIKPDFVSIGADSKGHKLPEPNKEKTLELIKELEKFTEVKIKHNLNRIIN